LTKRMGIAVVREGPGLARTRAMALLTLLLALTLGVAACGDDDDDGTGGGGGGGGAAQAEGANIAFLPKQVDNPYFDVAAKGGEAAAKELDGQFKQVGPSEASAPAQVPFINTLTSQGVDAIAVSANDPNALTQALKRADQAGVKIVTYDSDTAPEARAVFVNQADTEEIGRSQVQILGEQIGNKGDIAILSAASTATNQNAWIKFMKDELSKPEYKDMKLVKVAYGNDDDQKSFQETLGLIQAYPNLKGIISPTTVGIAAAARALDSEGLKGKIALTGLGTPNQMRKYVKNGTVEEFALWDPEQLGYLAYYAAAALANDQITGEEGETFEAGSLGKRTIGKDGVVILGPPTRFNKENIDDFNF
jgi:rhamnose transport system substrate-binding protein